MFLDVNIFFNTLDFQFCLFCRLHCHIIQSKSSFPGLLMSCQENINIFKSLKVKNKSKQCITIDKIMILLNYILASHF